MNPLMDSSDDDFFEKEMLKKAAEIEQRNASDSLHKNISRIPQSQSSGEPFGEDDEEKSVFGLKGKVQASSPVAGWAQIPQELQQRLSSDIDPDDSGEV